MTSEHTDPPIIRFHNCRVVQFSPPLTGGFITPNLDEIWIRSGHVIDSQQIFYLEHRRPDINIDCKGAIVAPGLVDVQVNGGWGIDFSCMNHPEEGIRIVGKHLLKYGVTSFCPTIISSSPQAYRQVVPFLGPRKGSLEAGAAVLGGHLEGPFISLSKPGCHNLANICSPKDGVNSALAMYGDSIFGNVAIVTIAPELPGALPVIEWLSHKGVLVSLGHSSATISEGEKGVRAGARFVTHLFNAMLPFHHRDPGLIGLLAMETKTIEKPSDASDDALGMHFGIIADGVHVHPAALRVANRMAPSSLCLVSDMVVAAGLPDGVHNFPGLAGQIEVRGRRATLLGRPDTLAGAVTLLDECVRTFKEVTSCSIDYSLAAASKHPAAALGLLAKGQCGSLAVGATADLILVDPDNYSVKSTYLAGECVYSSF